MSQSAANKYRVYHDADEISLDEITLVDEQDCNPCLRVNVSIDGSCIENVTFKRDIASKGYAIPPTTPKSQSSEVTILFGGVVQEILDNFADHILPPMKPLGLNPLTGEKVLDPMARAISGEIMVSRRKIEAKQFIWQK